MNPVDVIRERLGLSTDAAVGDLADVVFQTVSYWRANREVPIKRCWKIADRAVVDGLLPADDRNAFVTAVVLASETPDPLSPNRRDVMTKTRKVA